MIVGSSLLSALDQLPLMLSEDMNVSTGNIGEPAASGSYVRS